MNNLFAQYTDYNYESLESTSTAASDLDPAAAAAVFGGLLFFTLILTIASYVVTAIFLMMLFKKAGVEGWKAWVPIYNVWVFLELGGQQGFWSILMLFPPLSIVTAIFGYIASYNIGLKLGKQGAFVLLAIFLPLVWLIWLAVDGSKWHGKKAPATTKTAAAE